MGKILNDFIEQKLTITPEDALQILASLLPPDKMFRPTAVFLAWLNYIIARKIDGSIEGIWEELLSETLKYSEGFDYCVNIDDEELDKEAADKWLDKFTSSCSLCPDPYLRLEIFRLKNILHYRPFSGLAACKCFIETISQIDPKRYCPSGGIDDLLFCLNCLHYFLVFECEFGTTGPDYGAMFRELLNKDLPIITKSHDKTEIIVFNTATKFILNCIRLSNIFAIIAMSGVNDWLRHILLERLCAILVRGVFPVVDSISEILSHKPFHQYIIEFMKNVSITALTTKYTRSYTSNCYTYINELRSIYLRCTPDSSRENDLPKLIQNRQLHDSRFIQQNYMLISRKMPASTWYTNFERDPVIPLMENLIELTHDGRTRKESRHYYMMMLERKHYGQEYGYRNIGSDISDEQGDYLTTDTDTSSDDSDN